MKKINITITGAFGRMGKILIKTILKTKNSVLLKREFMVFLKSTLQN